MNNTLSSENFFTYLKRGKLFMSKINQALKNVMDKVHGKHNEKGTPNKKGIIVIQPMEPQPQTILTIQIGQKEQPDLNKGLSGILGQILNGQKVEGADDEAGLSALLEGGGQPGQEGEMQEGQEGQEGEMQEGQEGGQITAQDDENTIAQKLQQYDQETLQKIYEVLKSMFGGQ